MNFPSLQILHGEWDDNATIAHQAKLIGYGVPEKDPTTLIYGREATIFNGDVGILLGEGVFPFDGTPWTEQIHGEITAWTPFLVSYGYPKLASEFAILIAPTYVRIYHINNVLYRDLVYEAIIPVELRGGHRTYTVSYDGKRILFSIDGQGFASTSFKLNPQSNRVSILAECGNLGETVARSVTLRAELVRLDIGYELSKDELYKFSAATPLDVSRSFFDPEAVDPSSFQTKKIVEIKNHAPTISENDILPGDDIIPVMAANVSGIFTASASSSFNTDFQPWMSFRAVPNNLCWVSANWKPSDGNWHSLYIESQEDMVFNGFLLQDRPGSSGRPIRFMLMGLNADTGEYDLIKEYGPEDYDADDTERYFFDFPTQRYRKVRLAISEVRPEENYAAVGKFQLFQTAGRGAKKVIRYSDNDLDLIPIPTSAEVGTYVADIRREQRVGIQFDSYAIKNRTWANAASIQSPRDWTLEGRMLDEDTWTVIDTQVDQDGNDSAQERTYPLGELQTWAQVRIHITDTNGSNAFTSIGELSLLLDGVVQTQPMTADVDGTQTAAASSHYTSNGVYPPFMAFNQTDDGGWVSEAKATVGAPQWLSLVTTQDGKYIVVVDDQGNEYEAGEVVDQDYPWQYPEGTGYLYNDEGTLKFVPFTTQGIRQEDTPAGTVLSIDRSLIVPVSPENSGSGIVRVDPNTVVDIGLTPNQWSPVTLTTAQVDGVAVPNTANGIPLVAGKYYGTFRFSGPETQECACRLVDGNDATLFDMLMGDSGSTESQVYLDLSGDTQVKMQVFTTGTELTIATNDNVLDADICISSLILHRVG